MNSVVFLQHDEWAARQQPLMKFIRTNSTPPLYYKPKKWNSKSEELLKESQRKLKGNVLGIISFNFEK